MSERFLKFIPSSEAMWLLKKKGHAYRLLTIIAESARRYDGDPDGLKIGECFIGGHENYDMSEQNYRTAKEILVKRQHIEIVETCRTRKKSTTGVTTVGTKVRLLSTNVWDINTDTGNDQSNECPTTDQRPTNDKLRKNKKEKNEQDKEKEEKETLGASLLADFFISLKSSYPAISEKKLLPNKTQIAAMNRLLQLHSEDIVRAVFSFAHSSDFWVAYVHTACYLEKKFDTLNLQRLKPKEIRNENSGKHAPVGESSGNTASSQPKFQPSRVLRGRNDSAGGGSIDKEVCNE